MKYTTIFIDFDDTLIDTQGYATICLKALFYKHKIDRYFSAVDDFIKIYHVHVHNLWESYALGEIDKATLQETRFDSTFEMFENIERSFLDELSKDFLQEVVKIDTYIDGAKDILDYLKPKYKIVMLSNGFSELQYDKIDSVGFTNYFDEVVLSDVVGVNKPHPDIFQFALDMIGTTSDKTIMIGDNYLADIKGAINSNIDQIWYNPKREEAEVEPTYTISRLEEIKSIL